MRLSVDEVALSCMYTVAHRNTGLLAGVIRINQSVVSLNQAARLIKHETTKHRLAEKQKTEQQIACYRLAAEALEKCAS